MNNILTRFTSAMVFGISWVIAWQQILYANALPGDGFTAGILMLVAIFLVFVSMGYPLASRKLPVRLFYRSMVGGIVLLAAVLFAPLLWEGAMLEAFYIPLGKNRFSSTLLFDVAIFLVVCGGMVTCLTRFHEPGP